MTALLLAGLAAVLYGSGIAVEHRQAARPQAGAAGRLRMLIRLIRQPLWLAGAGLESGGFAAHAMALRTGSLAAVQMILSCSLLVSISVTSGLTRRRLPPRCWLAIGVVVAAVGTSLALLSPDEHATSRPPGRAGVAALVIALAAVPFAVTGLAARGRRSRALLLAVAAGTADTCAAIVTMAFTRSLGHGLGTLMTSWPIYALAATEIVALILAQLTYQADTPLISLPVITTVTPLTSLAVGIFALHETALLGDVRLAAVLGCLALAVAALGVLAHAGGVSERTEPAKRVGCDHGHPIPRQDLLERAADEDRFWGDSVGRPPFGRAWAATARDSMRMSALTTRMRALTTVMATGERRSQRRLADEAELTMRRLAAIRGRHSATVTHGV